jgi:hypothetical protein
VADSKHVEAIEEYAALRRRCFRRCAIRVLNVVRHRHAAVADPSLSSLLRAKSKEYVPSIMRHATASGQSCLAGCLPTCSGWKAAGENVWYAIRRCVGGSRFPGPRRRISLAWEWGREPMARTLPENHDIDICSSIHAVKTAQERVWTLHAHADKIETACNQSLVAPAIAGLRLRGVAPLLRDTH